LRLLLAAALLLGSVPAGALDLSAVDRLYWQRNEGQNLDEHIKQLDGMLAQSPKDPELLWRKGRALFRRGEKREKKADKLADFIAAEDLIKSSLAAKQENADAHFWFGVAMGKRGETQGIMKSLFLIKPIRHEMAETLRLDPARGGPHRVLGEILWQVPGMFGGDKKKALDEFETAVRLSPKYTANYQPLAEAYVYFDRKDDAVKLLKSLEDIKDPEDPAAYPDDLADAKKLLDKLSR
jgi:predicted Zn-dependent protease